MAENKKSFILYCDIMNVVDKLTDEQAGRLFKHILKYVNDQNPVIDDILLDVAFEPIKQALKRDLVKYEEKKDKRRISGKQGANKRWQNMANAKNAMPNIANAKSEWQTIANIADSVSVSVNDNVNVNDSVSVINKQKTPNLEQVINKFISLEGTTEMAERYFSTNESRGWVYNGSPIVNWEASIPAYIKAWKAKDNKQMDEHEKIAAANRAKWQRERERFEQLNK
jgi:hypothetical protein